MNKKIIGFLFLIIVLLPFIKVKAASNDTYIDWNLDRSVVAHQIRDGQDHTTNLAMITANGVIAYCIEPGVTADKASYYSSTTNINETKLKNVDEKKLSLIGYYGYGYKNHTDKKYYMAAQELIWEMFGVPDAYWTTSSGEVINIDSYKNEILNLVNNYEVAPSFDFKDEYIIDEDIVLNDNNVVLDEYELISDKNIVKENNNIKIKVKEGDNTFTLKRKENGKSPKYFYKDGYQTIASFEFAYSYEKEYTIKGIYGKIIVDKLDFDSQSKTPISTEASLSGAVYGLYDDKGNLIKSLATNEDGFVYFDKLTYGNYIVKEISPSKGYVLNEEENKVLINSDSKEQTIKSYEKIIENEVVITKVLDDYENKTCTPEEGILFSIYDLEGNLKQQALTDKNGNITFKLVYGTYLLRQETTKEGIDKVDDRIVKIDKDGITQNIALVNHRIKEDVLPNTGKNSFGLILLLITSFISGFLHEKKHI